MDNCKPGRDEPAPPPMISFQPVCFVSAFARDAAPYAEEIAEPNAAASASRKK